MERRPLTVKQSAVFEFIKWYFQNHQQAPLIREIQEGCGIVSYKSAVDKLLALERKGWIDRRPNKHRGIVLKTEDGAGMVSVGVDRVPTMQESVSAGQQGAGGVVLSRYDASDVRPPSSSAMRPPSDNISPLEG